MKRRGLFAIIIVMSLGFVWAGCTTAIPAEDYTGTWYASGSGGSYEFREGIIVNPEHQLQLTGGEPFSGAYVFSSNSILVFAEGVPGLEEARELYLVSSKDGDILCANPNGTAEYFRRSPQKP